MKPAEQQFYRDVILFYKTACGYLKENVISSGGPLWKNAEVSVFPFADPFPCMVCMCCGHISHKISHQLVCCLACKCHCSFFFFFLCSILIPISMRII